MSRAQHIQQWQLKHRFLHLSFTSQALQTLEYWANQSAATTSISVLTVPLKHPSAGFTHGEVLNKAVKSHHSHISGNFFHKCCQANYVVS